MSIVAQLVNNLLVSKKLSGALVEYRAIQPICCTFPLPARGAPPNSAHGLDISQLHWS